MDKKRLQIVDISNIWIPRKQVTWKMDTVREIKPSTLLLLRLFIN
jgi:hypothetical protein